MTLKNFYLHFCFKYYIDLEIIDLGIFVCLFVCLIITHEPLDRLAKNFDFQDKLGSPASELCCMFTIYFCGK